MTEVAADFVADVGQPEAESNERSEDTTSTSPTSEMGLGMLDLDDTASEPAQDDAEQTEGDPDVIEPADADNSDGKTDNLSQRERDRREADRYFQQNWEQHRAEMQREREAFQKEQETWRQQSANQQPTQSIEQQLQADAEALRRQAMQVADPQQQRALLEQAAGIEYVDKLVEQRMQGMVKDMGLDSFGQLREVVQRLSTQSESQRAQAMRTQINEAVQMYGQDVVSDPSTLRFIERNRDALNEINPSTGQTWTLAELLGRWTGRTAEEASAARQTQRTQRNVAKTSAAPRGQSASVRNNAGGVLSKSQAIAEIAQTL